MSSAYRAIAIASPPLAALIVLVAGAITPGYDPATITISRLAVPGMPAAAAVYGASIAAGMFAFRRLVDPKQLSAKVAGGLLYAFALVTLLTGAYEPLLLRVASLALAISSVEGLVAAIKTIHKRAIAKSPRCQAPQASNDIAIKAGAVSSMPPSARS